MCQGGDVAMCWRKDWSKGGGVQSAGALLGVFLLSLSYMYFLFGVAFDEKSGPRAFRLGRFHVNIGGGLAGCSVI